MSDAFSVFASVSISLLVAWPILIHVSVALPAPAERQSQLQTELQKAQRAHCAEAYASAGLLAVIPLAKDAVTGKGCKW